MYDIAPYTFKKAKLLGVTVKVSERKHKKIDVYKNGTRIATIGDTRYPDYAHLRETNPPLAEDTRRLYHLRHTQKTVGERMAKELLW
jgi:hypothetical protein